MADHDPSDHDPLRPTRRGRRWLVVLAVLALALWLARDLPRTLIERLLARELGASSVSLDGFTLSGFRHLELHGLEVGGVRDYPVVGEVRIEKVDVEGKLTDLLEGRYQALHLAGLVVELLPGRALLAEGAAVRPLVIGELVAHAMLRLCAADPCRDAIELPVDFRLSNAGDGWRGKASLAKDRLELRPLAAWLPLPAEGEAWPVDGELRELAVAVELADRPDARVLLGGGRLAVGPATLSLGRSELVVDDPMPDGAMVVHGTLNGLALRLPQGELVPGDSSFFYRPGEAAHDLTFESPALRAELRLEGATLDDAKLNGLLKLADLAAWRPSPGNPRLIGSAELAVDGRLRTPNFQFAMAPGSRVESTDFAAGLPSARGNLDIDSRRIHLDQAELVLHQAAKVPAGLLPVALSWQGELGPSPAGWGADGRGRVTAATLPGVDFDSVLNFDPVDLARSHADLRFRGAGFALEKLAALAELPDDPVLSGNAAFTGRFQGSLPGGPEPVLLEAELSVAKGKVGELATDVQLKVPVRWRGGAILFPQVVADATLALLPKPLPVHFEGDLELEPRLGDQPGWKRLQLRQGRLKGGVFAAELAAELRNGAAGPEGEGTAKLGEVGIPALLAQLGGAPPVLADYTLQGRLNADTRFRLEPSGDLAFTGTWRLAESGFEHRDGSRVLAGLGLEGPFEGALRQGPDSRYAVSATVRGHSGGFQILWDTLYGDFSTASVDIAATLEARAASDWSLAASAQPLEGPHLELNWRQHAEAQEYAFELRADQLDAVQRRYLTPLFGAAGGLEVGGRAHLQAQGTVDAESWTSRGRLELNGQVATPIFRAEGIDLELPFDLRHRGDRFEGERQQGRLAYAAMSVQGLHFPAARADLWTAGDDAGFDQSLAIALAGGTVSLEKLRAQDLLGEARIEMAVALRGVRLEELAASFSLPPLEGEVNGNLPRVQLAGNRLEVDGGGTIELFGGRVELGEISGEDLISRYPRLRLSARFHEIDLGKVTRRFNFGEMQGIVEGYVEDCELFRGLPLSFRARVESVKRPGVRQTVDVKAVQNLTVLGTGGSVAILDRGIRRFFQRYYYAKLGIEASLANDALLLRGLAHRGDRELFLLGRLPLPIDVVNAQPGKTVSFQNMVRRLQRLDLGAATSGPP